ncbi:30S ribosomal protein S7, partial [Acinetobacter baumannii]|nr:30S ribosomal protein S7 [Acinetobacter baumannii]
MPRRRVVAAREILPDPKFSSQTIAKFMNHVMQDGKKSIAESIVYGALERVQEKNKVDPVEFFETTLEKVRPLVEVKARRDGGATYQGPMAVRPSRRDSSATRWLREAPAQRLA